MKRLAYVMPVLAFLAFSGCKEADFLYLHQTPIPATYRFSHKIKEMQGQNHLDILWIIDNSGSMREHQNSVISNADIFIREFTKKSGLDWKMGLISTDDSEDPYVGFTPATELNHLSPDPVRLFQRAVDRLGTDGSPTERTLSPVATALRKYPNFLRPDSILAMIIVTDAPEQSSMTTPAFLKNLVMKKGSLDNVVTYGVLGPEDFGCDATDDDWNYAGSKYEALIKATHGKTYPLCSADFGEALADVGQDLVSRTTSPRLYLSVRPVPSTIRVFHKGKNLPGGPKESGGFWTYNYELNALVFHDLNWAPGDNEEVEILFTMDMGEPT